MSFAVAARRVGAKLNRINCLWRYNGINNGSMITIRPFSNDITEIDSFNAKSGKREMNIEFLLSLFQNLHSRQLTDVMTETLSEFALTKEQTMSLLNSNTFMKLNQHIVIALLNNDAIIRNNVEAHDLWEVLKQWSIRNMDNTPESNKAQQKSSGSTMSDYLKLGSNNSSSNVSSNNNNNNNNINERKEWLRVMKIFLPFIKFEEMDATFFMNEIECIPDEYGILSKDRKYQIVKQHCYDLIEEKRIREKMDAAKLGKNSHNISPIIIETNDKYNYNYNSNDYKRLDKLE